eukprot:scaffold104874_cov57-Phaeocystis_antarctica.AAC.1
MLSLDEARARVLGLGFGLGSRPPCSPLTRPRISAVRAAGSGQALAACEVELEPRRVSESCGTSPHAGDLMGQPAAGRPVTGPRPGSAELPGAARRFLTRHSSRAEELPWGAL